MTKLYVGIDPDKGYAVWDGKKKIFLELLTLDFFKIIDRINWWDINYRPQEKKDIIFYVEAPYLNKTIFKRDEYASKIRDQKAQKVGENKAKAKLIVGYIKHKGFKVYEMKPNKYSYTKTSAELFKKITGYHERTSEHARDAGMLVFGR